MEYIPGQVHEKLQKEHFFLVNYDFNWSNCGPKRYSELSDSKDWDELENVQLSGGDIIVVRLFKPSPSSETYLYLERIIHKTGNITEYKTDSIISLEFILVNKGFLFTDITKQFMRDKIIESILYV